MDRELGPGLGAGIALIKTATIQAIKPIGRAGPSALDARIRVGADQATSTVGTSNVGAGVH